MIRWRDKSLENGKAANGAPCHAPKYRSRREPELEGEFWGHLNNLKLKGKGESSISEKRIRFRDSASRCSARPAPYG